MEDEVSFSRAWRDIWPEFVLEVFVLTLQPIPVPRTSWLFDVGAHTSAHHL
jgi:hypothetical protein